jgi:hypothetical protein
MHLVNGRYPLSQATNQLNTTKGASFC